MSKNKLSQLVVSSNEDVVASSLLYFLGDKIEDSGKQDIFSNI